MKVRTYFFGCLLSVLMWQCAPKENEYVVIAGKGVAEDTAWMKVAEACPIGKIRRNYCPNYNRYIPDMWLL